MDRGPGGLQSMGSQRVRHDWVTELWFQWLNWSEGPHSQGSPYVAGSSQAFLFQPHGSSKHVKHPPASGPLHSLFFLYNVHSPQIHQQQLTLRLPSSLHWNVTYSGDFPNYQLPDLFAYLLSSCEVHEGMICVHFVHYSISSVWKVPGTWTMFNK